MKYFENLFMRGKLLVSFGVVVIMFITTVIIAYFNINSIILSEKELHDVYFQIAFQTTQLRSNQNHNRAEILEMMLTGDKSKQLEIEKNIDILDNQVGAIIKNLSQINNDPIFQSQLKELQDLINTHREGRIEEIRLIKDGKIEEARQIGTGVQAESFEKIRVLAYAMADLAAKKISDQLAMDTKQSTTSTIILIIFALVAFAFTNLVIILLNKTIAKPLSIITEIASSIALGDLSEELETIKRKDEVGQLFDSFKTMQVSMLEKAHIAKEISEGNLAVDIKLLSEKDTMGSSFKTMVENLRSQLGEIGENINVLSSSSSEIMASINQLASTSVETATSVSETTTTVEEVKQTAEVTSYKAKEVSDKAANSASISLQGETAIENAVEGMYNIQKQMESIAGIIVRLSEQSQTISEITSSVNEISEQSNLLAVNAAIEAAKAGEHGKGFGVVAQEIKNLSERSKEANLQIRSILRDIQKSISTAVMATEEGNKVVNEGLKLNAISGESIKALSESVNDSVNAAIQIAASSIQQLEGMDQIATAMESIKEASLQASSSTQQSAVAVKDIQQMAGNLNRLMKQYKM